MDSLTLVANPGSASRKYALFDVGKCLIKMHFEYAKEKIIYTTEIDGQAFGPVDSGLRHLEFASSKILEVLEGNGLEDMIIKKIALRIVAPSTYFQVDRVIDQEALAKLTALESRVPLHIEASLQEVRSLQRYFPDTRIIGISDSAFHSTMPEHASYYGLPRDTAHKLDIKRFGYHGLSVESAVETLRALDKLPLRLVVCHLGSGSSVTAVQGGKSLDTTMGYSPLEGVMMATRSGSLDITAALALRRELKLNDAQLEDYLNHKAGLLGLSGQSSNIRQLLKLERQGNYGAILALDKFVYSQQQAIGQMSAALGGIDALVFTGTVGERSAPIRRRVVERLLFLGLVLDSRKNHLTREPTEITQISPADHPARIYILPADEASVLARRVNKVSS